VFAGKSGIKELGEGSRRGISLKMQNEMCLRLKVKVNLFLCLTKHHARKTY